MLSDLYARLLEVGDLEKPRLVLFFDEAHLLFADCPPALLRKIEQTVRLIRSKGVGVYFVTQSPQDVPELIREQLAHRIEHDRALPVGAARVATMDQRGRPLNLGVVKIDLPECPLGALTPAERPVDAPRATELPPIPLRHWLAFMAIGVALVALAYGAFELFANVELATIAAFIGAPLLLTIFRKRRRHA